jgi:hypothetical protein
MADWHHIVSTEHLIAPVSPSPALLNVSGAFVFPQKMAIATEDAEVEQ